MATEKRRRRGWLIAIPLLWLLFAQALNAARAASLTFDEGPHLAVGYATLRSGDLRLQPVHIHPPLANVLAAAPLLLDPALPDPRAVDGWEIASLSAVTDAVVWQYPHPARLALAGRLPIILLALLGGALVFRWAADSGGPRGGLWALALYALDPNVVAHGALVTTDTAVTAWGLLTFFLLHRHTRHPSRARLTGVGLALGLALASKVSAALLLPLVGALLLVKGGRKAWRQSVREGLIVSGVAFVVLWAVYGFELRPFPLATHRDIYRSLQGHYQLGHPAFLMGQNSDQGWWFYFPLAFAIKTPLPTLLLLGAALLTLARRRQRPDLTLALFPLVYLATALFSSVDIGYRHLLPTLPFLYVLTGSVKRKTYCIKNPRLTPYILRLTPYILRLTPYILRLTPYALLLWLAAGAALVHPHPLTFFNELAGGPGGGYRWLVDSNLDWGQNLWDLRDWMRENRVERVYYSHYSPARPEAYGVAVDWLPPDPRAAPYAPLNPTPGWYAIGATTLQGVYTPDVNTYAWFRGRQPDAVLGHALFLYQVPERPAPDWAAVCFDFPLDRGQIRAGFGASNLRLVYYDCAGAQVYPLGAAGRYLLPPGAESPAGATLDLGARHADGAPAYGVWNAPGAPVPQRRETIAFDGPLTFLGYDWGPSDARPGETVVLRTYWQVEGSPARPLSLMAHLVGPDGVPIAVGDGLGVPPDQWQRGDVIVQRHRLQLPDAAPAGRLELRTGVYWLDTLERWVTEQNHDAIILEEIKLER